MPKKLATAQQGFTLVEILVVLGLVVIGLFAITQITQLYLRVVANEKYRVTASTIGNQKIETIRNLPYHDIGTLGGIPPANLPAQETVLVNNKEYTVTTEVVYIDDPFDGLISTTGSDNSIYNPDNPEVLYYWSMESNTEGQAPDVGNGTLSFDGTTVTTGYQGNGLQIANSDEINTTSAGNINISEGRMGLWYKPENADADDDEYFVRFDTSGESLYFARESNEKIRFAFGGNSIKSDQLNWNADQWYFIEVAWSADYRQIWRDGVPVEIADNDNYTPPTLATEMYIGHRGDNQDEIRGVIDELYILSEDHKYEIWGYNQSNPYFSSNPQVTYYWSMDDASANQTPEKGNGTITLGGNYSQVDPGIINAGLEFSDNGHTDYASISPTDNIDFSEGRVGFWYSPRKSGTYSYNTPNLLYAGCTDGSFNVTRDDDDHLAFTYGSGSSNVFIESQAYDWNKDWWYWIEAAWQDDEDEVVLYINRQEVARSSTTTVAMPTGCNSLYVGNNGTASTLNGEGSFDEFYILNDAFPESGTADTLNTDYKRVKVTVEWEDSFSTQQLYMITDIAPPGIESTDGGGTLVFRVIDGSGIPVPDATIAIYNNTLDPIINLSLTTDADGRLILPGAPATSTSYQVTVSKPGYSTDFSMTATSTYINPTRDHLTVVEGKVTEVGFSIDKLSAITVNSVSQSLPVNWQINTDQDEVDQNAATLATVGSSVYLMWEDVRTASTSLIFGQEYQTDGTQVWTDDVEIGADQSEQYAPHITVDAGNIYTVWEEATSTSRILMMKTNSAGSALWSNPTTVSQTITSEQTDPQVITAGGNIFVTWQDTRNDSGDIYLQKLDTDGNKLWGADIKINTDSGTALQTQPRITIGSDNTLYVTWLDERNGQSDIYTHKFDLDGTSLWPNEIKVNTASSNINNFDVTITSDDVSYILWSDNPDGHYNLYWQGVASTSALAYGKDQAITTQAQDSNQQNPQIVATDNDDLVLGWHDNRGGGNDVYVLLIDTIGTLQWPQEVQLNLSTAGDQTISDIGIYDSDKLIATWTDYSQTDTNVWAGTLNYDGSESPVPFIDFNLKGSKLTHSEPDLRKYEESSTTDAAGTITITDLEWDTYELELTDGGVSLVQIDPPSPFVLNPATSTTIKLIVN